MFVLSALMLSVTDQPAAATPAPATVAEVAVAEAPKKERQICKREPIATSLHGSKRICMTARQWRGEGANATVEDFGSLTTK